jgi:hypothetical protein
MGSQDIGAAIHRASTEENVDQIQVCLQRFDLWKFIRPFLMLLALF